MTLLQLASAVQAGSRQLGEQLLVSKRLYATVYDWLRAQCSIWAWVGRPFPAAVDPRFGLFAERNGGASGETEITHHVVWVGGVKLAA